MIGKDEVIRSIDFRQFYMDHVSNLKLNGNGQGKGLCEFHDDTNPSLSVNTGTGQYHCFSCDAQGDIFSFYQRLKGVDFPTAVRELAAYCSVPSTAVRSRVVALYEYTDEAGNVLYRKKRIEPGQNGRSKEFRFEHMENGTWVSGRGGDAVPYRLYEVAKSNYCFVAEGEGKADLLRGWGLTATCLDSGANSKLKDEHIETLSRMKKIVILPDDDRPGQEYAQKFARALYGKVSELKVVELPDLPEAGDIVDWARVQGNTKEKLLEVVKSAPVWTPESESKDASFSLSKALKLGAELLKLNMQIDWLVEDLIPKVAITLFSARGGMGKTILSITLADAVSRGIPFLGLKTSKTPVVYIDFENSLPVLAERVKRVDAHDVSFWHGTNEIRPPRLDSNDFELYRQLPEGALLIFDTLRASQSRDENDSQHMASVMQRLKELRDAGFTILILHHTQKSNDRTYKGSSAIYDLSDHTLNLCKVKRNTALSGENESSEDIDEEDCYYKFSTADKTRYEPFSIFLEFDSEIKNFKIAPDHEAGILQEIYSLLLGRESLKTNEIFELVKSEMGIKGKAKFTRLLKKGTGKYWQSYKTSDNKTIRYRPLNHQSVSPVSIARDQRTDDNSLVPTNETNECSKNLETLANTDWSVSPVVEKTNETNDKSLVPVGWTNAGVTETGQEEKTGENISENLQEQKMESELLGGVIK